MGVLDRLWTGQYTRGPDGAASPLERPAVLSDVDNPEDWWEISSRGSLALRIRLHYPFLSPVTDAEGALVDVLLLCQEAYQEAAEKAREVKAIRLQEAARRGYRNAGRVRPKGLMPFLSCMPPCNETPAAQDK